MFCTKCGAQLQDDANGPLVLTGKKSGEVFETGMTKSQADEMKRNSGFSRKRRAILKTARRQMFRLRKRAKGESNSRALRLRVRARTASATSGQESRTAQWEEMQRAENSPP